MRPYVPRGVPDTVTPGWLQQEFNGIGRALANLTTPGVSGATVIYPAPTVQAVAGVAGDDGAGATFVDVVAWNPAGAAVRIATGTTNGAPAARTYSVSSGALRVAMGAGTYSITVIIFLFQ